MSTKIIYSFVAVLFFSKTAMFLRLVLLYSMCMEIEKDFDPNTMQRATTEDILRIYRQLWGREAELMTPLEDEEIEDCCAVEESGRPR